MSAENFNSALLKEIARSIQEIKYGEIVIKIHNSKVVEIEKKEKRRFEARPEDRSRSKRY